VTIVTLDCTSIETGTKKDVLLHPYCSYLQPPCLGSLLCDWTVHSGILAPEFITTIGDAFFNIA
jgi:hypothetical protein